MTPPGIILLFIRVEEGFVAVWSSCSSVAVWSSLSWSFEDSALVGCSCFGLCESPSPFEFMQPANNKVISNDKQIFCNMYTNLFCLICHIQFQFLIGRLKPIKFPRRSQHYHNGFCKSSVIGFGTKASKQRIFQYALYNLLEFPFLNLLSVSGFFTLLEVERRQFAHTSLQRQGMSPFSEPLQPSILYIFSSVREGTEEIW